MRSFISRISLLMLGMIMAAGAFAGSPLHIVLDKVNDPSTSVDDIIKFGILSWPDGMDFQFFYNRNGAVNQILLPTLNDNDIENGEVIEAINEAIKTWNSAKFGSRKFADSAIPSDFVTYQLDPNGGFPSRVSVDGFNVITFTDAEAFSGDLSVATASFTYMTRDFDYSEDPFDGVDLSYLSSWYTGGGDQQAVTIIADFDFDGNADLAIPYQKYDAGDLIDFDITFDPALTDFFNVWPQNKGEINDNDRANLYGSVDIQATLTTLMGFAQGVGYSYIQDSTMFPDLQNASADFPTDPYRKRQLQFDDQMAVGIVAGGDFGSDRGSITGQVLNGDILQRLVTELDDGTLEIEEQETDASQYVPMVPVFVGRRLESDELAVPHPDNEVSNPVVDDENKGTYRLIAQVMTGEDLEFPAGLGLDFEFELTDPDDPDDDPPGQGGDDDQGDGEDEEDPNQAYYETVGNVNSNYAFHGLEPYDENGDPITYAVFLGLPDEEFALSPAMVFVDLIRDPVDYPEEFYGGPDLLINSSSDVIENINGDEYFENAYVTTQVNEAGRISASINDGVAFLSGFRTDPSSFIQVKSPKQTVSNRFGPIGRIIEPVIIQDDINRATAFWEKFDDFGVSMSINVTNKGGSSGLPSGLDVSYRLTNITDSTSTYTFQQVLDTFLFGRENPIYMVGGDALDFNMVYEGGQVPPQIVYQTSINNPTFSSYVELSGGDLVTPSRVRIDLLNNILSTGSAGGTRIGGDASAMNLDTAILLSWENIVLEPGESTMLKYIVGFNPPGTIQDTWVPYPEVEPGETPVLNGDEDDPERVVAVPVEPGMVTSGIDIITNTGTATDSGDSGNNGLRFIKAEHGFPDTDFISSHGALGDLDNDGDLDCVVSTFSYGGDTASGQINRIYLNMERINADGTVGRYFKDVTFGDDGVPDTPDDRLMPFRSTLSRGTVLADFDGDGDLDIFFSNATSGHQFYLNEGPENPGFFTDISEEVLPGLLNSGYNVNLGFEDAIYAYRATAGDIDSDGDLDLIISHEWPFTDGVFNDVEGRSVGTYAFLDASPRDDDNPVGDGRMNMLEDFFSGPFYYTERVLINQINQPSYAVQNQADVLPVGNRGFFFIDETLGSDNRTGTLTSLTITQPNDYVRQQLVDWDPAELDRMPPVFPVLFNRNDDGFTVNITPSPMGLTAVEPLLGPFFSDNSLDLISLRAYAQDWSYSALLPETAAPDPAIEGVSFVPTGNIVSAGDLTPGNNGTQSAYFRNMDLFSVGDSLQTLGGGDGLCDGYFACMNYNMDYGVQMGQDLIHPVADPFSVPTGPGLFAYTINPDAIILDEDAGTTDTYIGTGFIYDAFPLFIGLPEGHPADYTPTTGFENNLFPDAINRPAWAGVIGDFDGRNSVMPFIAADNDSGVPMFGLTFDEGDDDYFFQHEGLYRGLYTRYSGIGKPYRNPYTYAYQGYGDNDSGINVIENPVSGDDSPVERSDRFLTFEETGNNMRGEPYGVCAGDFDRDGDIDIFIATSTQQGITDSGVDGAIHLGGGPSDNILLLNNSLGGYTDASHLLIPNSEAVNMFCLTGDVDNDGDLDLIVLSAGGPNDLYINQLYNKPPDLVNKIDAPLFFDVSLTTIPQNQELASAPPFAWDSFFSGVTINATIGDFDMNGMPDILTSEGGRFTLLGDYAKLLFNGGQQSAPGAQVFHPAGAPYPAPRLNSSGYDYEDVFFLSLNGTLGYPGFVVDSAAGDLDNDGDLDIVLIQNLSDPASEAGDFILTPQILMNIDSDDPLLNSAPDPDDLGDGIFQMRPDLVGPIEDPDKATSGVTLKKLGRKIKLADVNGDGRPDIIIANGRADGGAPNVILMNDGDNPGSFTDETEKRLPAQLIGELKWGVLDNTEDLAVADFDSDGDLDIVFANDASNGTSPGFRFLINDGSGRFIETEAGSKIPLFDDPRYKARGLAVGDIDMLGEPTEDVNYNGVLDIGEDLNGNGQIDWEDLPTETEDLNGNGVLDPGEDGLIDNNGEIDQVDLNGDGLITARRQGVWDGSLDIYVSFDEEQDQLLINYLNTWPATIPVDQPKNLRFANETSFRFPGEWVISPSRGATMGDIDLDGDLDIVVAQSVGGAARYVIVWRNETFRTDSGHIRFGAFKNISHEVPVFKSMAGVNEVVNTDVADVPWVELEGQESMASLVGFANDVDLFDYDLDGDLDMFISCMGSTLFQVAIGSPNVLYENRIIGDSFNKRVVGLNRQPGSPIVYALTPHGGKRGQTKTIELTGENFTSSVKVSFGADITVLELQVISPTKMVVTVSIAEDALLGNRRITIYDPETAKLTKTKDGAFVIYEGLPGAPVPNRIWELFE